MAGPRSHGDWTKHVNVTVSPLTSAGTDVVTEITQLCHFSFILFFFFGAWYCLDRVPLYSPGYPQTQGSLVSACWVLGLQAWATMPSFLFHALGDNLKMVKSLVWTCGQREHHCWFELVGSVSITVRTDCPECEPYSLSTCSGNSFHAYRIDAEVTGLRNY